MNRIELLIDSVDEHYGRNLGVALALKDSLFSVCPKGSRSYQVLLTDRIISAEDSRKAEKPLIILSHDPGANLGCPHVYIYGGLEEIAEKIYTTLEIDKGYRISRLSTKRSKIICVLSGAGGVGCSVIAIALGKELAMNFAAKVLYISFESIASTKLYFYDLGGRGTINEYIYHCFKEEKSELAPLNDGFLIDDLKGLSAFRPGDVENQLLNLSGEELGRFLDRLAFNSDFDYIILDMAGDMPSLSVKLLDSCHGILLVDDGKPLSLYKNEIWMQKWSPDDGNHKVQEKILTVTNKWESSMDVDTWENFFLEYDPSSFEWEGDLLNISISTKFGVGIRRLADELANAL